MHIVRSARNGHTASRSTQWSMAMPLVSAAFVTTVAGCAATGPVVQKGCEDPNRTVPTFEHLPPELAHRAMAEDAKFCGDFANAGELMLKAYNQAKSLDPTDENRKTRLPSIRSSLVKLYYEWAGAVPSDDTAKRIWESRNCVRDYSGASPDLRKSDELQKNNEQYQKWLKSIDIKPLEKLASLLENELAKGWDNQVYASLSDCYVALHVIARDKDDARNEGRYKAKHDALSGRKDREEAKKINAAEILEEIAKKEKELKDKVGKAYKSTSDARIYGSMSKLRQSHERAIYLAKKLGDKELAKRAERALRTLDACYGPRIDSWDDGGKDIEWKFRWLRSDYADLVRHAEATGDSQAEKKYRKRYDELGLCIDMQEPKGLLEKRL